MVSTVDRSEIAFFDLETTIPIRPGQSYAILEFGSILVCPRKLIELESYDTLVKPHDLSLISALSTRANGITADAVISAPTFSDVADRVYDILHGRVWAGHNIVRFDCVRLREAFAQINRPPPEPKGTIDSLPLLTQRFGRRAGNMKMASLAAYFGLGQQTHRSLDDVRMNLEVLKYCATVLFLESSLPDIFTEYTTTRATLEGTGSNTQNHTFPVESAGPRPDPFNMGPLVNKMETETHQSNEAMDEESSTTTLSDAFTQHNEYIGPDEVSIASITVAIDPFLNGPHRIQILHSNITMQIRVDAMRVRFGLSTKFVDHAGNPRLSFVVDANSLNLCNVLDACDNVAKRVVDCEWKPIVSRKPGFYNSPTIRLHLPTMVEGDTYRWVTEIYHKDSSLSSSPQRVVFSRYDVAELYAVFHPGSFVDAYFSLDPYNYQQKAGIRLMAKKLIFHSN